jgi:hypothetical protein
VCVLCVCVCSLLALLVLISVDLFDLLFHFAEGDLHVKPNSRCYNVDDDALARAVLLC